MNNHVNAGGSPSAPGGRASAGEIEKEMPPGEPAGGSAAGRKVRAAFYIDGFNLYHAIDRMGQPHLKWLNLRLVKVHRCNVDEFLARRPETADVRAHPA